MNQQNSGQAESKVDSRLKEIIKEIESAQSVIPMFFANQNEVDLYLNIDENGINKMTPRELEMACLILTKYCLFLQLKINKETAIKNWVNSAIDLVFSKEYHTFNKFIKDDVKRNLFIDSNVYAIKLQEIYRSQSIKIDSLQQTVSLCQRISECFSRISRVRGD